MKINSSHKKFYATGFGLFGLVLIFAFQNCSNKAFDAGLGISSGGDGGTAVGQGDMTNPLVPLAPQCPTAQMGLPQASISKTSLSVKSGQGATFGSTTSDTFDITYLKSNIPNLPECNDDAQIRCTLTSFVGKMNVGNVRQDVNIGSNPSNNQRAFFSCAAMGGNNGGNIPTVGEKKTIRISTADLQDHQCLEGTATFNVGLRTTNNNNQNRDSEMQTVTVTIANNCWPEQNLLSANGLANDNLGRASAISGNWAVSAAQNGSAGKGEAVVFKRDAVSGLWVQHQILVGSQAVASVAGTAGSGAASVAISSSGWLAVGSPIHQSHKGIVHIYKLVGDSWNELTSIAGAAANNKFGQSVAINGSELAVSAPGLVQVKFYTLSGSSAIAAGGVSQAGLLASADFGNSISYVGTRLAVGAPHISDSITFNSGKVFVYNKSGSSWSAGQEVTASTFSWTETNGSTASTSMPLAAHFGASVALSTDGSLLIGAPNLSFKARGGNDPTQKGGAFLFSSDLATSQFFSGFTTDSRYGSSVAMPNNNMVVVGAPGVGTMIGNYEVYAKIDGKWSLSRKVQQLVAGESFGTSMATDGVRIAVGAMSQAGIGGTTRAGTLSIFEIK